MRLKFSKVFEFFYNCNYIVTDAVANYDGDDDNGEDNTDDDDDYYFFIFIIIADIVIRINFINIHIFISTTKIKYIFYLQSGYLYQTY